MKVLSPPYKMTISDQVRDIFVYDVPRKYQLEAIQLVLDNQEDYDNFVISMPCGYGKSGVAVSLIQHFKNSYIVTHRKKLQDQYAQEFSIPTLYGRSNYDCNHPCVACPFETMCGNKSCMCDKAPCTVFDEPRMPENPMPYEFKCPYGEDCDYLRAKKVAMSANHTILGSKLILIEARFHKLEEREICIFDEAHGLENDLCSMIDVTLRDDIISRIGSKLNLDSPTEGFEDIIEKGNAFIKNFGCIKGPSLIQEVSNLVRQANQLKADYQEKNWLSRFEMRKHYSVYIFKPIWVKSFAKTILPSIAKKRLFMSATIHAEHLCSTLALDYTRTLWINVDDSPFPIQNRPIFCTVSGNLTHATMKEELPKVVAEIQRICDENQPDRILILPHTHTISEAIMQGLRVPRSLVPTDYHAEMSEWIDDQFGDSYVIKNYAFDRIEQLCRTRAIRGSTYYRELQIDIKAYEIVPGSIICTPYLREGYDGSEDKCRILIIPKVPYPSLDDDVIKKRLEENRRWYTTETAQSLIQSLGRAVRSESDHAKMFVLDAQMEKFYRQNKSLFPKYIRDAILWKKKPKMDPTGCAKLPLEE